ncbi:MAG: RdgB/HAM1 family non-canonical purine NTP pyrophosphatase, partial [Candidatus Omnitrophica bacterium]|nr:RdgB/HAM1 family non-canonical purine NTP pyrophosphatase [Candidatus Omnitrophota bacterium]
MKEIIIATKNPDKRKELKKLLRGLKIKVISLEQYPRCPDVKEGTKSFWENAIRKAMFVSKFTKSLALADDSGLETDALGGRPGVCSARFAGKRVTYAQNNQKLLKLLEKKKVKDRGAQFRCVVAICNYPKVIAVVEGKIRGRIALKPKGKSGFGYDPVFIIPRYQKTFAQLGSRLKNKISHRAKALARAKRLIV